MVKSLRTIIVYALDVNVGVYSSASLKHISQTCLEGS